MDEKMLYLIKDKPIVIPRIIFKNYKQLGINEEELIILIYVINVGEKMLYNPVVFASELSINKYKVMEIINSLLEKKILSISIEKDKNNKMEEYICLDLLYNKIMNLILDKQVDDNKDNGDIFSIYEKEFGRTLSPMEYELIKTWIDEKISKELLVEALKEAIYNGVSNLRYIEKIIYDWKKKGYKNKSDIIKDKEKYKKSKNNNVTVFDYNWLDDE